jgi:peptidoglycan hydrolase-like protein with peptidoglycan-binding domain
MLADVTSRAPRPKGDGMDDTQLSTALQRDGFLPPGAIDSARRNAAIDAFLLHGHVSVPTSWSRKRRVMAAKQLVCRNAKLEVGPIDGLHGPQTQWAFELYAALCSPPPFGVIGEFERRSREPANANRPAGRLAGQGPGERVGSCPASISAALLIPNRDTPNPTTPSSPTTPWPKEQDVESFYGPMGTNQVRLQLPFPMRIAWDTSKTVRSFLIHQRVHDSAARCFERIAQHYSEAQRRDTGIELFGGCLNVRRKRGGTTWSMHSWGIAIDFDPARNPLRSNRHSARLAQPDCVPFWEIWEEEGWVSLGRSRDFDWMHVEAVG